jgi:hypothetical protein
MKTALLLVVAAVLGAAGCGSSGGGQTNLVQVTYSYAANQPITLAPGGCQQVVGPVTVNGEGKTYYQVQDGSGSDMLNLVIIPDSFFIYKACGFTMDQTLVDVTFTGSTMDTVDVIADTYDLVATCNNALGYDCMFNLTWNATY